MTTRDTTTTDPLGLVGTEVHALAAFTLTSGFNSTSSSRVVQRGETFTITEVILNSSRDRNGDSWLEAHLAPGYESTRIGRGPWPEGKNPWRVGDREWADAREKARQEAWRQPTEEEQFAALREVERKFGPATPSNRSTRGERI